jgi:hypothetical protein
MVGGSPRRLRESLSSYLFPFSQGESSTTSNTGINYRPNAHDPNLFTPPSSVNQNELYNTFAQRYQQQQQQHQQSRQQPMTLPLTPVSSSSPDRVHPPIHPTSAHTPKPPIPLIPALFPYHASEVSSISHRLEIVTPPDLVLQGFITDHRTLGRTVFVHLPPPHVSTHNRPEILEASFSEVLRPHDPHHHRHVHTSTSHIASLALDIKESLTALLDLASDSLGAKSLILALDRDDREAERLDELLHSLMYAGGVLIKPGGLDGGWDWDCSDWVLVGIEL